MYKISNYVYKTLYKHLNICQNATTFINDNMSCKNYKINLNNHIYIYMLYLCFLINKIDYVIKNYFQ